MISSQVIIKEIWYNIFKYRIYISYKLIDWSRKLYNLCKKKCKTKSQHEKN
jgi:hypothetical protein